MKPGKTKSAIWSYFGFVPDKDGKPKDLQNPVCKKCRSTVVTKGSNTTNLLQHLKLHHPVIYKSIKEAQSATEITTDKSYASSEPRELKQVTLQESMSKFQLYLCSSKKWQKLIDAVTYCVAKDMMLLYSVEKSGFKYMLRTFDSHYELPRRNSPVSRKLKYLRNVNEPQLTKVAQHPVAVWRP